MLASTSSSTPPKSARSRTAANSDAPTPEHKPGPSSDCTIESTMGLSQLAISLRSVATSESTPATSSMKFGPARSCSQLSNAAASLAFVLPLRRCSPSMETASANASAWPSWWSRSARPRSHAPAGDLHWAHKRQARPALGGWIAVASRTIVGPFVEQMRVFFVPFLHGLHRRLALEG